MFNKSTTTLITLLSLLWPHYVFAQTNEARKSISDFSALNGGNWKASWAKEGTHVKRLEGLSTSLSGSGSQAAAEFINRAASILKVNSDLSDLRELGVRKSLMGEHVQFQRLHKGLPVLNGFLEVHVNDIGQVYLVTNKHSAGLDGYTLDTRPKLTKSEVAALAVNYRSKSGKTIIEYDKSGNPVELGAFSLGQRSEPELAILVQEDGPKLVYRQYIGHVRVIFDADSGEVIEARSLRQSAKVDGEGQIFNPNPVNTLDKASIDKDDRNYPAIRDAYTTQTLLDIREYGASPTRYRLIGPHVRVQNILNGLCGSAPVMKGPPKLTAPEFLFGRNNKGFEHTMVYFHLDKSQRYIQLLGFADLWNQPISVDAHGTSDDNSYYCPGQNGSGYLIFGDGGVDDAEDADVILHEYGHALQDFASGGKYSASGESGAMGEGFGDYWAYSAKPAGNWGKCFAEWDTEGGCLRRLDAGKKYPADYVGQAHRDGEIWSEGLVKLAELVGKNRANKIILQSHYLVPHSPSFEDGLQALLDADDALFNKSHRAQICSAFAMRGIRSPECGVLVRMTWDKPGSDMDVHLRHPDGLHETVWNHVNDVAYYNTNPEWGDPGSTDDNPILDNGDCTTTCVEERIKSYLLTEPGKYRAIAHYYSDHGLGSTKVTMQVLVNSKEVSKKSRTMSNPGSPDDGDLWLAYRIIIEDEGTAKVEFVDRIEKAESSTDFAPVPLKD